MNKLYPWQSELWQHWVGLRTRLPHALLLKGPQGVGKFHFAMNLAQSLLCEKPGEKGYACQSCSSCHWFIQETHPDFRLLQPDILSAPEEEKEGAKKPARQISVDQIRALSDFSNLSSHQGGSRIVLIHPAEAMNANAANALLKTLEEPAGNMLIILVCHKPQQLLATILSRCLTLSVTAPPLEVSSAWLQRQGISNPASLLAQAGFAPLLALQAAEDSKAATEYLDFLKEISQPAKLDIFTLADQLQRTEPAKVILWLQQWAYDLLSIKLTGKIRYTLELTDSIINISKDIELVNLLHFQKELAVAKREAVHPLNPRLLFESLLLSYYRLTVHHVH
ncbi:MAG: DNA polymerase III subunit delta' [Gallionellaceae bacterium]|nr:DNA polymerase III subunit delta' [Gallionellaceae bacterium]